MECIKCKKALTTNMNYCPFCGTQQIVKESKMDTKKTNSRTHTLGSLSLRNLLLAKRRFMITIIIVIVFIKILFGGRSGNSTPDVDRGTYAAKQCAIEKAMWLCEASGYTVDTISAEFRRSDKQSTGDIGETYVVTVKTLQCGKGTYLISVVIGENVCEAVLQYPRDGLFTYASPDFEHLDYSEKDIYTFTHTIQFDPDEQ